MYRFIAATLILISCNSTTADISLSEYNKCKAITDSLKRLVCYDELDKQVMVVSDKQVITPPEVSTSVADSVDSKPMPAVVRPTTNQKYTGTGDWQVSVDKNQADLSKSKATARLAAVNSIPASLQPELIIHCNSKNTKLYIDWGTEVGRANKYNVFIGDNKFPTPRWSTSKSKMRTFYPRKVIGMMRKMFEANQYSVEIMQKDGTAFKAEFDIRGIEEAVEPIRYACDW